MSHPDRSESRPDTQDLTLATRYGGFDATGGFVITDPLTPRPWSHVLANDRYGLVLSQSGSGFSWHGNCQLSRLNRWEQDLVRDDQGRYLYLSSPATGLISSTYQPTRKRAEVEKATYRPGSAHFERDFGTLKLSQTVFVPTSLPMEMWIVEIENRLSEAVTLDLGLYLELHLAGPGDWHREFQRLFMETRQHGDTLIAWKHRGLVEGSREMESSQPAFFVKVGGSEPCWITDKGAFLGRQGTVSAPEAMQKSPASFTSGRWDDPVAGARWQMEVPAAGSSRFVIAFGAGQTAEEAIQFSRQVCLELADAELEAVNRHWESVLGATTLTTGVPALDVMSNTWLPYQTIAGRMTARCAYYQQGGAYGYRDQLQDSLLALTINPEITKRQLFLHAEAMKADGSVKHWWHPGTKIAVDSHHIDTSAWLAFGALEYIEETADLDILDADLAYLDTEERGSLLDHMVRGLERPLALTSERGLPLMGGGDWNDGLSHVGPDGKGDSVWMAMFLVHILRRLCPVLEKTGRIEKLARFEEAVERLERAVELHGWDGSWYKAGHRDSGAPFGTHKDKEGAIFLNMQTWSVLAGMGTEERRRQAMEAAREKLLTPYGALLLQPAYSSVDPTIGYITRYAPGLRENGGVYSHASTWAVFAFAKWGDYESAWKIALGMLPPLRSMEDPDLYAAEPYVTPGNVDGPDSPFEGRAGWTWYTGSSAWLKRAILEALYGVKAAFDGLVIEPRPISQPARITRAFRGGEVMIEWKEGIAEATLDGAAYSLGTPIPAKPGRAQHVVIPCHSGAEFVGRAATAAFSVSGANQ